MVPADVDVVSRAAIWWQLEVEVLRRSCAPNHSELVLVRNREKGILAKGVSGGSSVTSKATKNSQGYWAQLYI